MFQLKHIGMAQFEWQLKLSHKQWNWIQRKTQFRKMMVKFQRLTGFSMEKLSITIVTIGITFQNNDEIYVVCLTLYEKMLKKKNKK